MITCDPQTNKTPDPGSEEHYRDAMAQALLEPMDFPSYDMELMAGRRAYLAGLAITENPHPRDSKEWDWWREGYDQ